MKRLELLTLLVGIFVAVSGLFAPAASASPLVGVRNAVGVIAHPGGQRVGTHEPILAGESRARAPGYDQTVVGSCVAPEAATNPLEGTTYTQKVLDQMGQDIYHGFPSSIDTLLTGGDASPITGGDGVTRTLVRLPGAINGQAGDYEWIVDRTWIPRRVELI